MSATEPVVDVENRTVTHAGMTFFMRPLADDTFTVMVDGEPVGRALYSFGAQGVVESDKVTEEVLGAVAEAWFAAIDG